MAIKLDKAIELLTRPLNSDTADTIFDLHDAQRLGAEALKRLEAYRKGIDIPFAEPLPGEDEPGMKRGNLRLVIRMTGKASEVFALFRLLAKCHGAKTLGEIKDSCYANH